MSKISFFQKELQKYRQGLAEVYNYPFMDFSEADYRTWFADAETPVGVSHCAAVEKWIDIQPNGDANFCVDFPDYSIGNIKKASIKEMWNSKRAESFRAFRRQRPLSVCLRCGAKYMAESSDS